VASEEPAGAGTATTAQEPVKLLRVGAVQLNARADRGANLASAERLVRAAAAQGAQLVVLPEKWPLLGSGEQLRDGAEPIDGPAVSWARACARELAIDLVAGSFAERTSRPTVRSERATARSTCSM
jgi:predicted amidohydrolase